VVGAGRLVYAELVTASMFPPPSRFIQHAIENNFRVGSAATS